MKRLTILVLVLMVAVAFTVIATGGQEVPPPGTREVIEYDTIKVLWSDIVPEHPCLYDEEILERFGIKFNIEYLSRAAYKEKIGLLLATGEGIEVITEGGPGIKEIKNWAIEGHFLPMSDYLDKVPNYRKMWTDKEWDLAYALAKNADGNIYWLPAKRIVTDGLVWLYRKGAFDRQGIPAPKTLNDVYLALKKIKAEENPNAITFPGWGWTGVFEPATRTHRTRYKWYFDIDTNKLEYGPATSKLRDALIFSNKCYQEDMLEKEFTTTGKQTWTEQHAKGNVYVAPHYASQTQWYNDIMKSVDPDANWTMLKHMIGAYPGKGGITDISKPIYNFGPIITHQCPEEKIDRFLEYVDWSCTEEGIVFHELGIEGKTFEYKNGKPVFMEHMKTSDNPEGKPLGEYGFEYFMGRQKDGYIYSRGGDLDFQVWESVLKNSEYFPIIAWELTKDQEKDLADLETVIWDVTEVYCIKFILGTLDPSNDAHWNEFQMELKRVGLDKVRAIREEAIKKSIVY